MIVWFILIFLVSVFLAWQSMSDFQLPKEIKSLLKKRKIKGRIVFFKNKIKHFH
ncbi:MAG: hypothetical protein ACPLRN_03930 [Microgenomates group bacterium]